MESTNQNALMTRQKIRQQLLTEFNCHETIKLDLKRNQSETKGFKDILSQLNLNKKRKLQQHTQKRNLLNTMKFKQLKNRRGHRSLGQQELEENNSIMSKFIDEDLVFQYNNLTKGNTKLSSSIRLLNEELKRVKICNEKESSKFKKSQNNKQVMLQLFNYHSRNISQQKNRTIFKQQRKLKYKKIHHALESTEDQHIKLVQQLQAKTKFNNKLIVELKQLYQKQKLMKQKIQSVDKTSHFIVSYYQIQNYVDSILNKHDYPNDFRKRVSKLDAATDKILIFYNKQEALERQLVAQFEQLISTRQELVENLMKNNLDQSPDWKNDTIKPYYLTMVKMHSQLKNISYKLFDYYEKTTPYKPYQTESLMNFKKSSFKNITSKQNMLLDQELSRLFVHHPFIIKMFEQMSVLRKYSDKQHLKQLISIKCSNNQYEQKTEQLLTIICDNAVKRFMGIIISLINLIKTTVIQFTKIKSKINMYNKSHRIHQNIKGSDKMFSKTQNKLEKHPSKSLHGIPKIRIPTKKMTIALMLQKQKSVSLSEQYEH